MNSQARLWFAVGAVLGALGVGFGAFGAHGLREFLAGMGYEGDDLARRLANFDTAVRYQLIHALAIVLTALAIEQRPNRPWRMAAWCFLIGVLVFSGLLKVMTVAGPQWKWLGAIVPLGGLSMIAGWNLLAVGAFKK